MIKTDLRGVYEKGCVLPDPNNPYANVRQQPSTTSAVIYTIKQGQYADTTGYVYSLKAPSTTTSVKSQDIWIETKTSGGLVGYVHVSVVVPYDKYQASKARAITVQIYQTNAMLANDEKIRQSLIVSAKSLYASRKNGAISQAQFVNQANQLFDLYKRWQNRQNYVQQAISKNEVKATIKINDSIMPAALSDLNNSMGVIPVVIVIVILVAALSVTATVLVSNLLAPKYSESEVDLKKSKLLEQALSTLTPAEAQQVTNDLEKQIDNAYATGVTDGNSDTLLGNVKTIGLVLIGGIAVFKLIEWNDKRSNQKQLK